MDEQYLAAEELLKTTCAAMRELERQVARQEITSEEFKREAEKLYRIKEQAEADREYALSH